MLLKPFQAELAQLKAAGLYRQLAGRPPVGIHNFSSNDYLGFAAEPDLLLAGLAPAAIGGLGAGAARLIRADHPQHRALEDQLATFKHCEAALLFSSGYQANLGVLSALAGPEDIIFSDALNHASIIDGCRLSRATVRVYPHLQTDRLGQLLAESHRFRRRIIVTDSIFGMDGDAAPVAELSQLADRHDALFVVDEAHATGVYGDQGRGLLNARQTSAHLQITTFGKALGTFGAAVAGPRTLIDYLVNRARPFIFTTALPPLICAATTRALELLQGPQGQKRLVALRDNIDQLTTGLKTMGLHSGSAHSPIQPLRCASPQAALDASHALLQIGYFAQAIRPPTVPTGTSRLRLAVNANHSADDITGLLAALSDHLHLFATETAPHA